MEKENKKISSLESYFKKHSQAIYTLGTIIIIATCSIDLFTINQRAFIVILTNVPVIILLALSYILFLLHKISSKQGIVLICYLAIANIVYTQVVDEYHADFTLYFMRATLFFMVITTVMTLLAHRMHAIIILVIYYFIYFYNLFRTNDIFFVENITTILFTYFLLSFLLFVVSLHLRKVFNALSEKTELAESQNKLLLESNAELERNREELRNFNKTLSKKNNKLMKREEQLKKAVSAKDKFISIIAHDLKNPSQTLKGFLEMLHKKIDTAPKEKIHMYINHAKESSEQLNKLLLDLLDWSRSMDDGLHYEPRNINLKRLANNVIDFLKLTAMGKNVILAEDIPEDIYLFADYNMLFTIIRNLVSNSIKFSFHESIVTISARENEKLVTIEVIDTGIGMDAKTIEKIFKSDMNFTSPGTEGELGTGLGLKISRELIEKHKGILNIESTPQKGTTISIVIPKINQVEILN